MAINKSSHKITETEIAQNQLQGKSNPLKGNVSENQAMFDKLPKKVAQKFNAFVDAAAEEINNVGASYEEHKENTENPHLTTAHQVGAYTKEESDEKIEVVKSVALGRAKGYVFDTKADLDAWLSNEENTKILVMGDNFYIRDTSVPDYWWDADSQRASELETQKVDLSEYAKAKDVENEISAHTGKENNPHQVTASQVGAYTKFETDRKFAQKSDISNVYRFKGSVETTDDLPDVYTVKAIGDATDDDGNVVGTYNQETGEFDFDYRFTIPAGATKNIYIPCTPVVLKPGWYLPLSGVLGDIDVKSDVWPLVCCIGRDKGYSDIHSYAGSLFVLSEEIQIKYITVVFDNSQTDEPYDASITGTGNIFIDAVKVIYDENDGGNWEYYSAPQKGDVYNTLDTDINYAWTGTEWDTLGGEHKDLEAREEIAKISADLDKKADKSTTYTKFETDRKFARKSDISNVYKFRGSIEKYEDLPYKIEFNAIGPPVDDKGQTIGTFDSATGWVTVENHTLEGEGSIRIPVDSKNIETGYYACGHIDFGGISGLPEKADSDNGIFYIEYYIGDIICAPLGRYYQDANVSELVIVYGFDTPVVINGSGKIEANLYKVPNFGTTHIYEPIAVGDVYNISDSGTNYAWNGTDWDSLGGEHKDLEARDSIEQLSADLDKKADKTTADSLQRQIYNKVDKSYITNVYKFMGSVETFDDLPIAYPLIPNGVPTFNGEPCGTYDEETHTVTIDDVFLENVYDDEIAVPIVPISIKSGKYFTISIYYGHAVIGNLDTYACGAGGDTYVEMPEQTIDHIGIYTPYGEETIGGSTDNLGTLEKIVDSWLIYEGSNFPEIPNGAYDSGAVYNVIEDGMNYAWNGTEWDALGGSVADESVKEDIDNIKIELDKKVNKSDVVSAYRFCGSVETFDDLPIRYDLIPNGAPTLVEYVYQGNNQYDIISQPCGTYDEKTHTVTVDVDEIDGRYIRIPIVPITLKPGIYFPANYVFEAMYIGSISSYPEYNLQKIDEDEFVTYVEIFNPGLTGSYSFSVNNLGYAPRVIDSFIHIDENDEVVYNAPSGAYDPGAVYEVKNSGLSYGWTGSTWDALGTSHIDSEAREDIENLESQMGDVETALDSIIEIQNSLIGGSSE